MNVFFELLSPLPLNSRADARRLFQIWNNCAPLFFPDRYGLHEPLKSKFSLSSLDDAIRVWEFQFLTKRLASPKLESTISMQYGPHRRHSSWTICLKKFQEFDPSAFQTLFEIAGSALLTDFGLIHAVASADILRGQQNGSLAFLDRAKTQENLFVATHLLQRFIPDIYWTILFGPPYVELFTRERILTSPVHRIKELASGAIVLQLTPELSDVSRDEAGFERIRDRVRDHLDSDAIFSLVKGKDYKYRVPKFTWLSSS